MSNWVRRIASASWICENCDDEIKPRAAYYLMATGERYCDDCPPDEAEL